MDKETSIDIGLTPTQEKAIRAILNSRNLLEAAKQANIPHATMQRWIQQPAFIARFHQLRRELAGQAVARAQASIGVGLDVLVKLAQDESAAGAVRVTAAWKLVEFGLRAAEYDSLRDQVTRLQALVGEQQAELGAGEGEE